MRDCLQWKQSFGKTRLALVWYLVISMLMAENCCVSTCAAFLWSTLLHLCQICWVMVWTACTSMCWTRQHPLLRSWILSTVKLLKWYDANCVQVFAINPGSRFIQRGLEISFEVRAIYVPTKLLVDSTWMCMSIDQDGNLLFVEVW